jgi:hypothetical protein
MKEISLIWAIISGLFHMLWIIGYGIEFFYFFHPENWRHYTIEWGYYLLFVSYSVSFLASVTYFVIA